MPATLENQHDVVGSAAARAGQQQLHGTWREVVAAAFWRAVHDCDVTAAGLRGKQHSRGATPVYGALHDELFLLRSCGSKSEVSAQTDWWSNPAVCSHAAAQQ